MRLPTNRPYALTRSRDHFRHVGWQAWRNLHTKTSRNMATKPEQNRLVTHDYTPFASFTKNKWQLKGFLSWILALKVYFFKEKIIFEDKALRPHDPHDRDKTLPRVKVNFVYKWFSLISWNQLPAMASLILYKAFSNYKCQCPFEILPLWEDKVHFRAK